MTTFVACAAFGRWRSRTIGPFDVLVALAVSLFVLTDLRELRMPPLRDLQVYLHAGSEFLSGAPVYLSAPLP